MSIIWDWTINRLRKEDAGGLDPTKINGLEKAEQLTWINTEDADGWYAKLTQVTPWTESMLTNFAPQSVWSFDKTLLHDSSLNEHPLSIGGGTITQVAGKLRNGANMSAGRFYRTGADVVIGSNHFCYSFWCKLTALGGFFFDSSSASSRNDGMVFYFGGANTLALFSQASNKINGTTELEVDTWYLLSVAGNGAKIKMYINADVEGIWEVSYSHLTNNYINIGSPIDALTTYVNGIYDEFVFENKAGLFSDEADMDAFISSLYKLGDGRLYDYPETLK